MDFSSSWGGIISTCAFERVIFGDFGVPYLVMLITIAYWVILNGVITLTH